MGSSHSTSQDKDIIDKVVEETFWKYDVDNSGYIDTRELAKLLQESSTTSKLPRQNFTAEEINKVLERLDHNQDRRVSKSELTQLIKSLKF